MSNPNERKTYTREVRQESYNDANNHPHTEVTQTTEAVNSGTVDPSSESYRDGYVHGQITEHHYQEDVLAERDNNNASRGLLLGILLTSLVALTVGAIWLLNQRNEVPSPVVPPVMVPDAQPEPTRSPEANQPAERETIIRERPVFVPVPQQQAPAPQAPSPAPQPNINITVPNSAPQPQTTEQAPSSQTAPTQPQNQSSSTENPDTQSDTRTTTPAETQSNTDPTTPSPDTLNRTDTTSGSSSSPTGTGRTNSSPQ